MSSVVLFFSKRQSGAIFCTLAVESTFLPQLARHALSARGERWGKCLTARHGIIIRIEKREGRGPVDGRGVWTWCGVLWCDCCTYDWWRWLFLWIRLRGAITAILRAIVSLSTSNLAHSWMNIFGLQDFSTHSRYDDQDSEIQQLQYSPPSIATPLHFISSFKRNLSWQSSASYRLDASRPLPHPNPHLPKTLQPQPPPPPSLLQIPLPVLLQHPPRPLHALNSNRHPRRNLRLRPPLQSLLPTHRFRRYNPTRRRQKFQRR